MCSGIKMCLWGLPHGPRSRTRSLPTIKSIIVYAANVEQQLAPYVGRAVILRAKLVDLSGEGYGQELWIATIRALEAETR